MDKIRQFFTNLSYDLEGFFKNLEFTDQEKKISLGIACFLAFCFVVWLLCFAMFWELGQTIFGWGTVIGLIGIVGWAIGLLIYKKMKG